MVSTVQRRSWHLDVGYRGTLVIQHILHLNVQHMQSGKCFSSIILILMQNTAFPMLTLHYFSIVLVIMHIHNDMHNVIPNL